MSFASLGLSAHLLRAVAEAGHLTPTSIQARAIPIVLRGGDVVATAETGSGKTAAFVLPILESFRDRPRARPRATRALIVVPTRELAVQIGQALLTYGRHLPVLVKTVVVCGGGSLNPQRMALRGGADVLVATPGRLLDLVEEGAVSLAAVATLVLDEADRMLALGFADELAKVFALLPAQRQTVLVSATWPDAVAALAASSLQAPTRVDGSTAAHPTAAAAIEQRGLAVDRERRTQLLVHLLEDATRSRVLVFVATKYGADHLARKLNRVGVATRALHGDLSQGSRAQALAAFKAGEIRVLVATDLAARGLDIPAMPCVVNFDLPRAPADYLHRIGRTGRAGETGAALSFVCPGDEPHFALIAKRHGLSIALEQLPGFEPAPPAQAELPPAIATTGGVKGKRPNKKDKLRAKLRSNDGDG